MITGHFLTWSFTMDLKILLLFIQTSSLVHTDENSTTMYQNYVDVPILTGTTEETIFSVGVNHEKMNASHTSSLILPDKHEFRITGNESDDQKNDATEIYEDIDGQKRDDEDEKRPTTIIREQLETSEEEDNMSTGLQRMDEYDENSTYSKEQSTVSSATLSSPTPEYDGNTKELSPTLHNRSRLDNSKIDNNSEHLMNSLVLSFVKSIWESFYKPLFKIVAALAKPSDPSDKSQNFSKSKSERENATSSRILLHNYTGIVTINTSIANDSDSLYPQSIHRKSFIPASTTTKSLSSSTFDVSEAIENMTDTYESSTTVSNPVKSQSKNDGLIFEIDTLISSTMEAISDEETLQLNLDKNMKNELIQNLFNAKNNSLNDDAALIFMKIMMENYNNSRIRRPFSSRYSRIHDAPDMHQKIKREISSNNQYNSADRQELTSYFYNDRKFRESYSNHAKLSDQDNLSPNIHNTDKIYNRPNFETYPIQQIYTQSQDNPSRESLDDSSMAHNFQTDLNDSSLLYLVDRLGYSIFDNAGLKSTSTEMSVGYDLIYSNYKWPDSRMEDSQQKRIDTGKNPESIMAHERQSNSSKWKKNKTRRRTKARGVRMKMSMKSSEKQSGRKNSRNSSKYLRTRSKYKRRNNEKFTMKNRKRGSLWGINRRRKSKKNRRRTKLSTKSRSTRYRPL